MRRLNYLRPLLLSIATVSLAVGYSPFFSRAGSSPDDSYGSAVSSRSASGFSRTETRQAYIVQVKDDKSECRNAAPDEAALFTRRIPESSLHVITPSHKGLRPEAVTGLQIVLRGTNQLDQFPQAKAAFLRAAANWEAVIATPISIVIDVDFGPNDFGTPFPKDVLGATDPQVVSGGTIYSAVKDFLIADAPNPTDLALYNGLPTGNVPTDLGATTRVSAPTATFRATGLLPSVADPAGDAAANLGDPPQVGFNSNFQFTFDPSSGIAHNTFDFDAVATHEIGHVLGFHSSVGETELKPPFPLSVSLLDIFRFRPGTVSSTGGSVTPSATLGTANRIESSGGDQVFFFGAPELALSTGRPDGTGGDANQASHWKSAEITGTVIGIMDPAIAPGERRTIQPNDLKAFEAMGYSGQAVVTPGTVSLTSGAATNGTVSAPQAGSCVLGGTQYTIDVPTGATQLTIDITGNQSSTDLLVRYGRSVTIVDGSPVDDYETPTSKTSQEIVISGSSSPPIAAGTYFIGVGNCATGALSFTITATVVGGATGGSNTVITALSASLQGNTLTLTGTATDPDGDITQAEVTFLDGAGHTAGDTGLFSGNFGTSTTSNFTLTLNNMQNFPSAVKAQLLLADTKGAKSAAFVADFSQADPGGPQITNASFNPDAPVMVVKGNGFATPIQLESNGVTLNVKVKVKGGGSKLKIGGSASDLNLNSGANRIRVLMNGLRSNIFVLTN